MNEVITKLYEMEGTAGRILAEAQRYKEQLLEQREREKKAVERELERELERKLSAKKQRLDEEAAAEILELETRCREQMDALEEAYGGHLDTLAEEIFQKILKT